jgi:biopolymer transport protein ExbB/TolQ
MKEILDTLLQAVIVAVVPVLTTYIVKFIQARSAAWETQLANETAKRHLEEITNAVSTAVSAVSQTYVENIRKSGEFNEEAQKQALSLARDTALNVMTEDAKSFIQNSFGDMEALIRANIEETVKRHKQQGVAGGGAVKGCDAEVNPNLPRAP